MKRNQESVQSMMMRLKTQFANAPVEVLNEITAIAPAIQTFRLNLDAILVNEAIQGQNMTGFTEVKAEDRALMVKAAIDCAQRGRSYALVNNLPGLATELTKPRSWYKAATDLQVAAQCKTIHDLLLPLLPQMTTYGLTSAKLTNLNAKVNAFTSIINAPRENTNAKKIATENIANLITENNELLVIIDAGVDTLEETQLDFWRAYKLSRKIVDPITRTMALKINVSTEDGVAVGKVKIAIVNEATTLLKKTTAKGNCQVQNLLEGTYVITFKKPGFADVKRSVNITNGERTVIKVVMKLIEVEVEDN